MNLIASDKDSAVSRDTGIEGGPIPFACTIEPHMN